MNEDRIKYLESKLPKDFDEKPYFDKFSKYATYKGNGVYEWRGILSTDPRELLLMGILKILKISYKEI